MSILWWSLTILLMLAGIVGTLLPLVPGHVLILAGAILHQMTSGNPPAGWWMIAALAALMLLGMAVDLFSGAAGAKYFGATRWGALGGILGAIIGMFFGVPGIIIGPLAGVLLGELLGGKGLLPAGKSTWGSLLGTVAGSVIKLGVALLMVLVFALSLLWK